MTQTRGIIRIMTVEVEQLFLLSFFLDNLVFVGLSIVM